MAEKLDVLIVHHHTRNKNRPILLHAVGLASMADLLEREGLRVEVVNLGIEAKVDPGFDLVRHVAETGARVVGFSIHWFFQLPDSLAAIRAVKAACPEATVVAGGFTASYFAEDLLRLVPELDAVIVGDGEVPFARLCAEVFHGGTGGWSSVPNLCYRDRVGAVLRSPERYQLGAETWRDLRAMNLATIRNLQGYRAPYQPTRKLAGRFAFERDGIVCLAPTRGCPFSCSLCGGNSAVQRQIFGRRGPIFQPIDGVVRDLRDAIAHGFQNFYVCSDPDPNGPYYHELFESIRDEGLEVGMLFEAWSLPDAAFVDDFARTFPKGLLIVSPDSGDEDVRRRHKGPLAYSNEALMGFLEHVGRVGLGCQLFFGFFLPGDTVETVRKTRRFAHDCETAWSESIYVAFSTDPGSPAQRDPDAYGLKVGVGSLEAYLDLLSRRQLSPNMLSHVPVDMDPEVATGLVVEINFDLLVHKTFDLPVALLRSIVEPERYHSLVEGLLAVIAAEIRREGLKTDAMFLVEQTSRYFDVACPADEPEWVVFRELLEYVAVPYRIVDEHFGGMPLHYAFSCRELEEPEGVEALDRDPQARALRRAFRCDVKAVRRALRDGLRPAFELRETEVAFRVDGSGRYVTR